MPSTTFGITIAGSITGSWLSPAFPFNGAWKEFGYTGSFPAYTSAQANIYDANTGSVILSNAGSVQSLSGADFAGKDLRVCFCLQSTSSGSSPVINSFYFGRDGYVQVEVGNAGSILTSLQNVEVSKTNTIGAGNYMVGVRDANHALFDALKQGDEVQISIDSFGSGTASKVMGGYIDSLEFDQTDRHKLLIKGRDYTGKLQSYTVTRHYSGTEAGSIVRELVTLVPELSGGQVSGTTITPIGLDFNQDTVFDAIKKTAALCDYDFWVDSNKVVYFQPSTYTRNSGRKVEHQKNIYDITKGSEAQEQFNYVTINGRDEILAKLDSFTGDGVTKTFQLTELPKSPLTKVQTPSGTTVTEFSGYEVNYGAGNIYFPTAPGSLNAVLIDYNYARPVSAVSQDSTSISTYGKKDVALFNDSITTRTDAQTYADAYITAHKNPRSIYKVKCLRVDDVEPRDTVFVYFPPLALSGTLEVMSVKHSWEVGKRMSELELGELLPSFTQLLGDLASRLKNVENNLGRSSTGIVQTLSETEAESLSGTTWGRNYAMSGTGVYRLSTYRTGGVYGSQISGGATFWSGAT